MDSPQTKEALQNIRKLIAEDDLDKAFDTLSELGASLNISSLSNDVTILSGKFSGLEKDYNSGIIKYEDFQLEKTKLSKVLTQLVSQVEDGSIQDVPIEETSTTSPADSPKPVQQVVMNAQNQGVSKKLDYLFMGLIVLLFLTCIGGLVFTLFTSSGNVFTGTFSMSGILGCLFSLNSWRSKLGVNPVLIPSKS